MAETLRSTLTTLGVALCDELVGRYAGPPGVLDRRTGAYTGDAFLESLSHLAPDIANPENTVSDAELAGRLRHAGYYLRTLVSQQHLCPADVDAILAAVDLTPAGPAAEPRAAAPLSAVPGQQGLFPGDTLVSTPISA